MYTTTVLPALALLLSASAAPAQKRYNQVQFTNTFPDVIYPNTTITLTWTGGSGEYSVWEQDKYAMESAGEPTPFVNDSPQNTYTWHAYANNGYDYVNDSITFGVEDANGDSSSTETEWYSLSPAIPLNPGSN